MAATYSVIVRCGGKERARCRKKLNKLGLRWESDAFYGSVRYPRYQMIRDYCRKNGLSVMIDGNYATRSSTYRKMFFKDHKPQIGPYYICSYCGTLLKPEDVTVDHLYPIKRAREDLSIQRKLRKMGITDINDTRNLVASCSKCNAHKAARTGLWIARGRIGQNVPLWILRKILRAGMFLACCYFVYRSGVLPNIYVTVKAIIAQLAANIA